MGLVISLGVFATVVFVVGLLIASSVFNGKGNVGKFFESRAEVKKERERLEHERKMEKMRLDHERESATWAYINSTSPSFPSVDLLSKTVEEEGDEEENRVNVNK